MKVLVIGAMGHIGSYLVRELVTLGHEVVAVSRGNRTPYAYDEAIWSKVRVISASRDELVASDIFKQERFDAVCDLLSLSVAQIESLVSQLTNDEFYLQIGSIWMYGDKKYLPVDEKHPHNSPEGSYGGRKGLAEDYLLSKAKKGELRCAVVHPGHISGKEWLPLNPMGNFNVEVYDKIRRGEEIILPFYGLATLHHIHSYDLTRVIIACLTKQDVSNGQAFISVAPNAMTMKAIAEALYLHCGHEPNIRYVSEEEFKASLSEKDYLASLDHISHSPVCSCQKSIELLGVEPKYSILDILKEYMDYNRPA